MEPFRRLPVLAQTAYARLLDQLLTAEAGVPGDASLVSKRLKGRTYWYAQRTIDGEKRQIYLGGDTPEMAALIERWRRAREAAADRSESVAIARAAGLHTVSAAEARVFAQLAYVFRIGGVLVGSHAFAVIGNLLGVHWGEAAVRTEDVDIVHEPSIAVALAGNVTPIPLPEELVPLFSVLDPSSPATTFRARGTSIDVDLLTPLVGRDRARTVHIPALNAAAQPLRFLDYLVEETQPGAVVGGEGTFVNVPRPGRFALHKLLVASRRTAAMRTKAAKDRAQASALLAVLLDDLPGELSLAWKAMHERGRGWVEGVRESVRHLDPALVSRLSKLGIAPGVRSKR